MSREQNSRRKVINGARRDKAKGHQTRRARGGKKQKRRYKRGFGARVFIRHAEYIYHRKGVPTGFCNTVSLGNRLLLPER